jgi:hypothetical protein
VCVWVSEGVHWHETHRTSTADYIGHDSVRHTHCSECMYYVVLVVPKLLLLGVGAGLADGYPGGLASVSHIRPYIHATQRGACVHACMHATPRGACMPYREVHACEPMYSPMRNTRVHGYLIAVLIPMLHACTHTTVERTHTTVARAHLALLKAHEHTHTTPLLTTFASTHTRTHALTHARTRTHAHTHAPTHARTHAHTRARTHTHAHTHACKHTSTHAPKKHIGISSRSHSSASSSVVRYGTTRDEPDR